ncbi:hypothetical protein ACE1AT_21860 [Pelatocladus sp. BLCC-F211]
MSKAGCEENLHAQIEQRGAAGKRDLKGRLVREAHFPRGFTPSTLV